MAHSYRHSLYFSPSRYFDNNNNGNIYRDMWSPSILTMGILCKHTQSHGKVLKRALPINEWWSVNYHKHMLANWTRNIPLHIVYSTDCAQSLSKDVTNFTSFQLPANGSQNIVFARTTNKQYKSNRGMNCAKYRSANIVQIIAGQ